MLHGRVGDVLESEPDGPRRHLDLLAYHYSRSDDLAKKRHYLGLAAAAARAAYANETAITYLEQLLPLVEPDERPACCSSWPRRSRSAATGRPPRTPSRAPARRPRRSGTPPGSPAPASPRAELARKQGRYVEAESELAAAETAFVEVGDVAGRARVLHLRGTLDSQQGHPDQARAAYEASLALREALGDEAGVAALLTNLALVAEDEDDLDERRAARPGGPGPAPRARRPAAR